MGAGTAMAMDQGMSDGMMMEKPAITLEGSAEMGAAGDKEGSTRFHTDIGIEFKMSGHTDGGVEFGTEVELADGDDGDKDDDSGIAVHLKGPFGNLELGDTDGAFDWALMEVDHDLAGSLRDAHRGNGYTGNARLDGLHDGQILRYDYSFSGFGFTGSLELDDELPGIKEDKADDNGYGEAVIGLGGRYEMAMGENTVGFGVGYQMGSEAASTGTGDLWDRDGDDDTVDVNDLTLFGASAHVKTVYGVTLIGNYSRSQAQDSLDDENYERTTTHAAFGIGYAAGPVSLSANVGNIDLEYNEAAESAIRQDQERTSAGLAVNYSLGGGATLKFGASASEADFPEVTGQDSRDSDTNRWSLGVAFKF